MKKPIDVSVIVISYNTREMTLECLRSIFRETTTINFEVIVLDNASTDGSSAAIASEFGEMVALIASTENFGFASGNNRASAVAKGKYLLLLNPDTVVLDAAIDQLHKFANAHPDAGIWGGRTLTGDRSLDPTSCWSRQTPWSLFCHASGLSTVFKRTYTFNPEAIGGWDRNGTRRVDIVTGCFLLIDAKLWKRLDGFREIFFMYGEEADLCLRAKDFGAAPTVTSDATIIHYGGASEKIQVDKMVRLLKSKMLLIREHFPESQKPLGYWLLAMWPVTRRFGYSLLGLFKSSANEKKHLWKSIVGRRSEWDLAQK